MNDDAVKGATALRDAIDGEISIVYSQLQALQARLADLNAQRKTVEKIISFWAGDSGDGGSGGDDEGVNTPIAATFEPEAKSDSSRSKSRPTDNSSKEDVAREARRLIEERRAPISRPDMLKALTDGGFKIAGSDPLTVLSTMLWRTRKESGLIHIRNHGYWVADRDYGPANYYNVEVDEEGNVSFDAKQKMKDAL